MTPAERYAGWRTGSGRMDERLPLELRRTFTELEVQAAWFSGKFPRKLVATDGRSVEIIHFGVWNREPGPDFQHAVVQIDGAEPVAGAVELDWQRADWERHGHATNPAYDGVVLHVFVELGPGECFTRDTRHRLIPQAQINLACMEAGAPFPPLAAPGRCTGPLAGLEESRLIELLQAAAHFRLTQKAGRWGQLLAAHGDSEALWQGVARVFGYKENKVPLSLLAQRLPIGTLRRDVPGAEALLFGCAGFLDAPDLAVFPGDTRVYLRHLWDAWWSRRAGLQRLVLPRSAWKFTGTRPVNHPQRRLAALAGVVRHWKKVRSAMDTATAPALQGAFTGWEHDFWQHHYTLTSVVAARPMALIGESRVLDLLINVAIPRAMRDRPEIWRTLAEVRQPLANRPVETAALRLFGDHQERWKLLGNALNQQGLLQIYEDFCLRDLSDCARCPFPGRVERW